MRKVRADIIRNLQVALEECNLADIWNPDGVPDNSANDLPAEFASSSHAFGAITAALRIFGGDDMVDDFFETGQWDINDRFYDPRQSAK